MSDQPGETPKIQVDSDWKSQAQAEKQRLADLEAAKKSTAPAAGPGDREPADSQASGDPRSQEIPPANWETLVMALATQALMCLGGTVDPSTNRVLVDLEAGKHHIDLLAVLEEKTKGNLTDEEANQLKSIIHELRMQFVRIAQAAQAAMSRGQQPGVAGAGGVGSADDAEALRNMASQLRMTEE